MNDDQLDIEAAPLIDFKRLSDELADFASVRNWDQFHSPKNLVMALSGEVGELSEIFQWLTEDASRSAATNPETAHAVRDELADVLLYLVRLSSVLGVDLNDAVTQKLLKNATNYPVERAYGSNQKYNKL